MPDSLFTRHTILLSLGTNLGDRVQNLQQAVDSLGCTVLVEAFSPIYETAPWGNTNQPAFLNICLRATTTLSAETLLQKLKQIETTLGRVQSTHWGPRLIDIDILFYDDLQLSTPTLTIPHPHLTERAFVLRPLADIAPDFIHPANGKSVTQLLDAIPHSDVQQTPQTLIQHSPRCINGFLWGRRTYVMGILNITPDSFSGDGLITSEKIVKKAVKQALSFVAAGADIIDVGGESTKPGSEKVSAETEQLRVLPVIRALRAAIDVPISIDSYRAQTAHLALLAGADWINDVSALKGDPQIAALHGHSQMAAVAFDCHAPVILMHNGRDRYQPDLDDETGGYYGAFQYDNLLNDIAADLQADIDRALDAGIPDWHIIIDPGFGFGKNGPQNLALLNRLNRLTHLNYPLLLGTSRKGFIGHALGGLPAHERIEGSAATVAIGIDRGADIIRVHDVAHMARIARMTDAIVRPTPKLTSIATRLAT